MSTIPDRIVANERRLRIGGVMRCCIATLSDDTRLTAVGDTLQCRYAPDNPLHRLRVAADGVWEWGHD